MWDVGGLGTTIRRILPHLIDGLKDPAFQSSAKVIFWFFDFFLLLFIHYFFHFEQLPFPKGFLSHNAPSNWPPNCPQTPCFATSKKVFPFSPLLPLSSHLFSSFPVFALFFFLVCGDLTLLLFCLVWRVWQSILLSLY